MSLRWCLNWWSRLDSSNAADLLWLQVLGDLLLFEGVSHHDRRITEYCQACCVDFIRSVTGDEINERDKANFFWCMP